MQVCPLVLEFHSERVLYIDRIVVSQFILWGTGQRTSPVAFRKDEFRYGIYTVVDASEQIGPNAVVKLFILKYVPPC